MQELAKRTGMDPRKLAVGEAFCRRMNIDVYDMVTGSVASGIFDRKGNIDIVIIKRKDETSNKLSSLDFMMFDNDRIIEFADETKRENVITTRKEAEDYAAGRKRSIEPPLVSFRLRDELNGHKISVFEVREDIDPWLAVPNPPSPAYQPFGTIMLTTPQPLTEKAKELVGRLSTEFDIEQVSDAYFAIAGQLLNVFPTNLRSDFDYFKGIWREDKAANSLGQK